MGGKPQFDFLPELVKEQHSPLFYSKIYDRVGKRLYPKYLNIDKNEATKNRSINKHVSSFITKLLTYFIKTVV